MIIIIFQCNNGSCLFLRCGNYTMNHVMCYPFVPIIFIFLTLVEFLYNDDTLDGGCVWQVVVDNRRNCVIHEISDYDLVFFHWNDLFLVLLFLANGWYMTTDWWLVTNNSKGILLLGWLYDMFINLLGRFWWTVPWVWLNFPFTLINLVLRFWWTVPCTLLLLLFLGILKHNFFDNWQWKK